MDAGTKAWTALLSNALGWEIIAPPQQMLSHAYSRLKATHPVLLRLAVLVTLLHLEDQLPHALDPYRIGLLKWARRLEDIAT